VILSLVDIRKMYKCICFDIYIYRDKKIGLKCFVLAFCCCLNYFILATLITFVYAYSYVVEKRWNVQLFRLADDKKGFTQHIQPIINSSSNNL